MKMIANTNELTFICGTIDMYIKLPVTRTVEKNYKSKSKSKGKGVTISNDNVSNSSVKFLQPICMYVCMYI